MIYLLPPPAPPELVIVEFRRTLFSAEKDFRAFPVRTTLAQMAAAFPNPPAEFEEYGAIQVARADKSFPALIPRQHWAHVRPKAGTCVFISVRPQWEGADAGSIFQIVGAVALVALVTWVSAGGLAFLAPALLGAGTVGASVAAAAIGVAGQAALSLLSKPAAGAAASALPGASAPGLATAGVAANTLGAYQQVPAVLGRMRVSPPFLARPYTEIADGEMTVRGVVGLAGPCAIGAVKINDVDADDLPDFTYEVREGFADDAELTLVTRCVFEENINLEMSKHRLDEDQATLLLDADGSPVTAYPKPHLFRTCRDCALFRILLLFPQGCVNSATGGGLVTLFRMRIRNRAGGDWVNLPELAMHQLRETPWRFEIRLDWSRDAGGSNTIISLADDSERWAYYSNQEWQAASYFFVSGSGSPSVNGTVGKVRPAADSFTIYLDPDTFAVGEYDVEVTHGAPITEADTDSNTYPGGLFSYRTFADPDYSIPAQGTYIAPAVIQSYASFRDQYPIQERGLALLAFTARNLQINSISAVFTSQVPVWDGADWDSVDPSRNPAALLRWVLTGGLNSRPVPDAILDTLDDFFAWCEAEDLTCDALITDGSVEQAATLAAQCGDAILRRCESWGVVIDRDRSLEAAVALFTPHVMTEPLTITKTYLTGSRGLTPSYYDAAADYAIRELSAPIYDDGVDSATALVEGAVYDGLTSAALVARRARMDLRRARLRSTRYSWGVHQSHLGVAKGDLVGVGHDVLIRSYATGRVQGWTTTAAGHLATVILNTEVEDAPAAGYSDLFEADDVLVLADLFALEGVLVGMQVQLADGSVAMIPLTGVAGATLTVEAGVPVPAGLIATGLISIGPREREVRRVIVVDIRPGDDLTATIEAVDEAPGIFLGVSLSAELLLREDGGMILLESGLGALRLEHDVLLMESSGRLLLETEAGNLQLE